MAYGDGVMEAIRGTVLDGHPRVGGVPDGEAARRERRRLALSATADYARSGRGGQGDSDMHLERAAEEALSQAALAGLMTYGRSALALGRRTLADQLARRRASAGAVLRRSRYQVGPFGEGVETLSDTALNPSTLTGARPTGRLGEVATVSREYSRAYPGIERDVVVNVVPDSAWDGYVEAAKRARAEWAKTSDTSRGFFDRRLSAVSLRAQMPGETMEAYFDRADRTLVHELQHYAQMRDGLPATSPGPGYEWYRTAAREVDARNSANRLVLTPQERAEIPRSMTQDVKPEDVHMDDKGGDNFGTFRNFLATDDVPESIFGIPVVHDRSHYTEKDLEFFRENPKAAGFYDLGGDEGMEEDVPQQVAGAGVTYDTPLTKDQEARYQKWRATLPKPLQYEGDYDLRGYWLDPGTVKDGIKDGQHFTDTYKKPNHPTFSVESKYAVGADLARAGWWEGEKFIPPRGAYPGSLNNPGNVEKRKERRQGEVDSPHERWAKFATPQDGLREMADAIRQVAAVKLAEKGLPFTIRNFAGVYAPGTENNTAKYVADISADSGFSPNEELHRFDEGDMARLLKSVVRFESGAPHSAWFTDEEYAEAAKKLQEGAVD